MADFNAPKVFSWDSMDYLGIYIDTKKLLETLQIEYQQAHRRGWQTEVLQTVERGHQRHIQPLP